MTQLECNIRLHGSYALADLDRLLVALAPLDSLQAQTRVRIDLRDLERISAPSIAVLVSALLDVQARGVLDADSTIVAPRDQDVRRRLQAFDVLELLVAHPPQEDFERRKARGSRPCRRFTGADEPGKVAKDLADAVAEVCQTDETAQHAMLFALTEIAQNVSDHAASRGGAVGTAEVTRGGAELEIAIADHGVGIRRSLARNRALAGITSDLSALRTAVTAGATARPNRPGHLGLGLYLTQLLLRDNGGAFIVRSGTARLELGATPSEDYELARMRGTLVIMRFRTDNPFSLEVILDAA
jgi:hypothetical protein